MLLEFWPAGLKGNNFDPFDLIERLYQLGYTKLFIIDDTNLEIYHFNREILNSIIEKGMTVNVITIR